MSDENTLQSVPADTIYVVQAGDSLSKIAQKFYGNAQLYPIIAERNGLDPRAILYIGSRVVIPTRAPAQPALEEINITAQRIPTVPSRSDPSSPGGSAPIEYNGQTIETVTTTASRLPVPLWQDWRFWATLFGVAGLVWFLSRGKK